MGDGADVGSSSRRHHARFYRRIQLLDESSASSYSEGRNELDLKSSSFLSDDGNADTSMMSVASVLDSKAEDDDESSGTNSFIVSDEFLTEDTSFSLKSASDASFNGSFHLTKRNLPNRSAKQEKGWAGQAVSSSHPVNKNPGSEINEENKENNVIEDVASTSRRSSTSCQQKVVAVACEKQQKAELREQICRATDNDSDSESEFEKYLKKLREGSPRKKTENSGLHNDSSFIVSDSDEDSTAPSEEESSGSSWSSDSENLEDDREPKQRLVNSIMKSFSSPSLLGKSETKKQESDPDEHFVMSLSSDYPGKRHPDAEVYTKKGIKNEKLRMELTTRLFSIFRRQCFKDELPEFLTVKWNSRLLKTAGMCRNKGDRTSCIELSPKVCTTADRVRGTLIHEMCHAAVWIIDGVQKEGHGPIWKKWANQCMRRFQGIPIIGRCHNYEIDAKFIYKCGGCGQTVKRHSKSLNIERIICGVCKSRFTLQTKGAQELNSFAKFVKANYGKYKEPGVKHAEVMRKLSQLYKETNSASTTNTETEDKAEQLLDISVLSIHE